MSPAARQLEELALVVHGALGTLHLLACLYHWRRDHKVEASLHLAAATYDVISAQRHWHQTRQAAITAGKFDGRLPWG